MSDKTMYYTYVLQSKKDKKLYTGATRDLKARLEKHQKGEERATKGRGPFTLLYYEACVSREDAFAREKYLKTGRGKKFLKNRLKHSMKKASPVRRRLSNRQPSRSNRGFVALTATIIVAAVLLVLTVTVASKSFYGRFNVLDAEVKEVSRALAEACVETAILKYEDDDTYTGGNDPVTIGDLECTIVSVDDGGIYLEIKTQAVINDTYTNLRVEVDPDNGYAIEEWEECTALDEC